MKGCWDPEFQPSEEEIMDSRDMAILSVRFLWQARAQRDFPKFYLRLGGLTFLGSKYRYTRAHAPNVSIKFNVANITG